MIQIITPWQVTMCTRIPTVQSVYYKFRYLKIFKQPMVKSICTQVTQYPGKHSLSVFLKHIFRPFFSLGLSNHHRRGPQSADYDIFWVKMFSWQGEWGAIFRGRVRGLCLLLPPRFCRERWSETQCLYQYELCPTRPGHWPALYSLDILRWCNNWTRCFYKIWVCGHF